jgi:recombination protein RecA
MLLQKHTRANPEALCAFIDMEHAYDTSYAAKIGVDLERLQIAQPSYGEQALEIADQLIETGIFDVVVIDSVAALVPKAELDGEMGENKIGLQSRLMSQALRKLAPKVSNSNTRWLFLSTSFGKRLE